MGELTPVQPADAIQFYPDFDEQDDELAFDRTLNDSDNAQVLKQPGQNQHDLLDTTKQPERIETTTPAFNLDLQKDYNPEKSQMSEISKAATAKTIQSSNFKEMSASQSIEDSDESDEDNMLDDLSIPQHFDMDDFDSDEDDSDDNLDRDDRGKTNEQLQMAQTLPQPTLFEALPVSDNHHGDDIDPEQVQDLNEDT